MLFTLWSCEGQNERLQRKRNPHCLTDIERQATCPAFIKGERLKIGSGPVHIDECRKDSCPAIRGAVVAGMMLHREAFGRRLCYDNSETHDAHNARTEQSLFVEFLLPVLPLHRNDHSQSSVDANDPFRGGLTRWLLFLFLIQPCPASTDPSSRHKFT